MGVATHKFVIGHSSLFVAHCCVIVNLVSVDLPLVKKAVQHAAGDTKPPIWASPSPDLFPAAGADINDAWIIFESANDRGAINRENLGHLIYC